MFSFDCGLIWYEVEPAEQIDSFKVTKEEGSQISSEILNREELLSFLQEIFGVEL
jgi:hypothetical protein